MFGVKTISTCFWRSSSSVVLVTASSLTKFLRNTSSSSGCVNENISRTDVQESENISEQLYVMRTEEEIKKYPRYALLLCYLGTNYYGMQFNRHGPSIEGKFFEALVKAGYFDEKSMNQPQYYVGYNRASRTDARVSALRQVVSIRMPGDPCIEKINECLPSDIRILGIKRTTKNFDSKKQCSARSYCYIMPTYVFCHYRSLAEPKSHYRIDADTLKKANDIFQKYIGLHRFHNYTEKRDHWDQRSLRRIKEACVSNSYIVEDMELVELHITGDSFMLHQIRRMIGMTIAVMRGKIGFQGIEETFDKPIMPTPTAPGLGLMLAKQHFDRYNSKFGDIREPLVWDEYDEDIEKFKLKYIVPHIVSIEQSEKSMELFLDEKLRMHSFSPSRSNKKIVELKQYQEIDESSENVPTAKEQ